MEKRLELEKLGRRPNQIVELNLDNCRSTSIVGLTDEFTALESLSLINVGLTTLKGFPNLPNLKKLELSDNRISNGLNYLVTSPKLTHLNLSGNKLKDLETLKPLEDFRNLEVLDLFNNEVTSVENYREKIFALIPSLKYLDGLDANELEASSEGDEEDDEVNGNDSEDEEEVIEDDEEGEEGDDDEDEEDGTDEEDNETNDVSLAMVYNEDLEEGNSEWGEENEAEEDEEDEESDEEEGDEAVNQKEADTPEQSQARGKKRKHDG